MISVHERGTGPAVVLVHGIPGSAGAWQSVAERLRAHHRVLVPDLVGFGDTGGSPPVTDLRADALARALDDRQARAEPLSATTSGGRWYCTSWPAGPTSSALSDFWPPTPLPTPPYPSR